MKYFRFTGAHRVLSVCSLFFICFRALAFSELHSISTLTFDKEGRLFVGDGDRPRVYSIDMRNEPDAPGKPFNLKGIDQKVARFLGVSSSVLRITDMVVHPKSKKAFLAVTVGSGIKGIAYLIQVDSAGHLLNVIPEAGKISVVDLDHNSGEDYHFWDRYPASSLSITHIEAHKGNLYITGLRSGEFASTLYKVPFPFNGTVEKAQVSYYHAVHDQIESRAPVISHKVVTLKGKDYLLAVYTCTPLVLVPLTDIKDGANIRGKIIAELGYDNSPSDMLHFNLDRGEGLQSYILINNRNRSASLLKISDITDAAAKPGISTPSGFAKAGVSAQTIPLAGVLHMDMLNSQWLLTLRRNIDSGQLDLITVMQGAWLRLSDFISEYNFPDYRYTGSQLEKKKFHDILKDSEGF